MRLEKDEIKILLDAWANLIAVASWCKSEKHVNKMRTGKSEDILPSSIGTRKLIRVANKLETLLGNLMEEK